MANILSFLIGFFALLLAIPAFLPFLGIANWLIIPIAVVGAIFGLISKHSSGMYFCLLVVCFCAFRLWLGGGLF